VGTCTIVNIETTAAINVETDFVPDDPASVTISVVCTSGTVTDVDTSASETDDADFTVSGFNVAGTTCTATEGAPPPNHTADETDCLNLAITDGAVVTCTITNTLIVNPFNVLKDFVPNNAAAVTVSLSCTTGTVVEVDTTASEANDANFNVNGPIGDPTCTATETTIPAGYVSTGTCNALLSVGTCTITNTETSATLNVLKNFTDDDAGSVTVSVNCTSGTVTNGDTSASEADDANFTVSGFNVAGTTCTATEGAVPAGYTKDESDCLNVPISDGSTASCTIVNDPIVIPPTTATFNVLKDFTDDDTGSVTIGLTCTNGGTVTPVDTTASEADDANFTIAGFTAGATCTATEGAAPVGYNKDESNCVAVPIVDLGVHSCTIINTPGPAPVGGVVEIIVPGTSGDEAGVGAALFGLIFVAAVAILTAGVATVRVAGRR